MILTKQLSLIGLGDEKLLDILSPRYGVYMRMPFDIPKCYTINHTLSHSAAFGNQRYVVEKQQMYINNLQLQVQPVDAGWSR